MHRPDRALIGEGSWTQIKTDESLEGISLQELKAKGDLYHVFVFNDYILFSVGSDKPSSPRGPTIYSYKKMIPQTDLHMELITITCKDGMRNNLHSACHNTHHTTPPPHKRLGEKVSAVKGTIYESKFVWLLDMADADAAKKMRKYILRTGRWKDKSAELENIILEVEKPFYRKRCFLVTQSDLAISYLRARMLWLAYRTSWRPVGSWTYHLTTTLCSSNLNINLPIITKNIIILYLFWFPFLFLSSR